VGCDLEHNHRLGGSSCARRKRKGHSKVLIATINKATAPPFNQCVEAFYRQLRLKTYLRVVPSAVRCTRVPSGKICFTTFGSARIFRSVSRTKWHLTQTCVSHAMCSPPPWLHRQGPRHETWLVVASPLRSGDSFSPSVRVVALLSWAGLGWACRLCVCCMCCTRLGCVGARVGCVCVLAWLVAGCGCWCAGACARGWLLGCWLLAGWAG
jgi:hypothetical protein